MRPYEVVLQAEAWTALARTGGRSKRRLLTLLEDLKAKPFRAGDYRQQDQDGRWHEVVLLNDWLVTFWSDHAVREIRVVNLQRVED